MSPARLADAEMSVDGRETKRKVGRDEKSAKLRSQRGGKEAAEGIGQDGLGDVVVEAGLVGAAAVILLAVAGERDQDRSREAGLLPQPAGNVVAVDFRQADVEHDNFRQELLGGQQPLGAGKSDA